MRLTETRLVTVERYHDGSLKGRVGESSLAPRHESFVMRLVEYRVEYRPTRRHVRRHVFAQLFFRHFLKFIIFVVSIAIIIITVIIWRDKKNR